MMSTNNNRGRNRNVDRLSSLPIDILIIIISFLPLRLAITTGVLSRRWRGLWTNTTSIDITSRDSQKMREIDTNNLRKFDTTLKKIMTQITSPFINSFSLEVDGNFNFWVPSMDNLICKICDRNVHQLKVIVWPDGFGYRYRLPSAVFRMQSLESVELGSTTNHSAWQLPDDCDSINLPNLKKLNIPFASEVQWIEKLIKACPSLEELSLNLPVDVISTVFRNVTRLTCNMKLNHSIDILLSVLEMCPVLDLLTLTFRGVDCYYKGSLYQKPDNVSTSQRTLDRIKSIKVEIDNEETYQTTYFIPLIVDLLRSTRNLEHFNVSVNDCQDRPGSNGMLNRGNELKLCKVLYRCPMASTCCDVEFKGRFFKMSRKDGPKAWTANGEVICFRRSQKGFLRQIRMKGIAFS